MSKPITIRKERFYPHSPEDVWTAISDPHALAEWLEPNDHKAVVGHKFSFRCDPGICGSGIAECEVIEADPPKRLVWRWVHVVNVEKQQYSEPMTIEWTLTPTEGGTLLALEHNGAEKVGWLTRNLMRMGWGMMMDKLITRVLDHVDGGVFSPGAIPLEKRYYKCETVPDHYVR